MHGRSLGKTYLLGFTLLLASTFLSGCGNGGIVGRVIATPAASDGRDFRSALARGPYRLAATGYESTSAFELRAQVQPPRANRSDVRMLPRSADAVPFFPFLVVRGTFVDDGAFRLKPETLAVDSPGTALAPPEFGELQRGFLAELRRKGSLPMPLLSDNRQVLRAVRLAIRHDRSEETDLSRLLDRSSLVPRLHHDEELTKLRRGDRVVVEFETLALHEDRNGNARLRQWLDGKRPVEAEALTHPGDNAHLKEAVDRALARYREQFATEAISMLDFVERFRLADCKMVALAALQKTSASPQGASFRAFVASGNRVEHPDRIDLTTSNHAWNGAIDGKRGETLAFADFTPASRRPLEYVFDASTLAWVMERLALAKSRDEFSAAGAQSVLRTVAANVPDALEKIQDIDRALGRLAIARIETLLPGTDWEWEEAPSVRLFPEVEYRLTRRHRRTGERVFVTIDPIFHWGRGGEVLYDQPGRAGVWDLHTDRVPKPGALALNGSGTTKFSDFTATVTAVEKSPSSHSTEHYWRVELLFSAAR
mgnify:CR=1 FL=1